MSSTLAGSSRRAGMPAATAGRNRDVPEFEPMERLAVRLAGMRGRMLMAVTALCAVGLVMVYSASSVRAGRHDIDMAQALAQGKGLALGLLGFFVAARVPLGWYRRWWPAVAAACLGLLASVLVLGTKVNGSSRWFRAGGLNIQPSEMAKPMLIVVIAAILAGAADGRPRLWWRVLAAGAFALASAGLVAVEPDLGSAALLGGVAFALLMAGGMWIGWAGVCAALGGLAAWVGYENFEHVRRRVEEWRDAAGFHTNASQTAIGSGGVWGMGLGQGAAKLDYLPEAHTDFIFAMVGQELGFMGSVAVVGLFAFFVMQGLWLARTVPDRFGSMVVFGITMMVGAQALFNMGVVTGLLPPKGIQLPFVSFGSSGLAVNLAMMGLLAAASRAGVGTAPGSVKTGDGRQ